MRIYTDIYNKIISTEALATAWRRFSRDKRKKRDMLQFEWNLEENILELHQELKRKSYKHGPYQGFYVRDPKVRHIHKATACEIEWYTMLFSEFLMTFLNQPSFQLLSRAELERGHIRV